MKKIAPVILCATVYFGTAFADAHYSVTIDSERPRNVNVVASVRPGKQGLCFSRAAGDTGLTHGWATFVHQLSVRGMNGESVPVKYDGHECWRIPTSDQVIPEKVTVSYTMLLQHDRFPIRPGYDEAAYAGEWGQFWTGRALFVEGEPETKIEVDFILPPDWKITAPWPASDDTGLSFTPPDSNALLDSGFMLGTQYSKQLTLGETTAHIGLVGDEPLQHQEKLIVTVDGALKSFSELHQAPPPSGDVAVFLGQATGRRAGGGVMGRTISMLVPKDAPDELVAIFTYMVTHEVFHLWNTDLNYSSSAEMYWFSEGLAEYYTFRTMHQAGQIDSSSMFESLRERESLYREAAGQISMVDAGERKLDYYNLVYSGGLMAALALDMHILETTNGAYRLDDVLPAIYEQFGPDSDVGLNLSTLAVTISEITGADTDELLQQYVSGIEIFQGDRLLAWLAETL